MEYLHHKKSCSINEKNEAKAPLGLFQNDRICEDMYYLLSENLESGFNMDSHKLRIVEIQKFVANKKTRNEIFLMGSIINPNTGNPLFWEGVILKILSLPTPALYGC